ncbi:MAG: hypothetical protein ACFCD0_13455 [Gemmataceae bacterium]
MDESRRDYLLSRLLDDELSPDEWKEVDSLLQNDSTFREEYLASISLHRILHWTTQKTDLVGESEFDSSVSLPGKSVEKKSPRLVWFAVATALALIVGGVAVTFWMTRPEPTEPKDVVADGPIGNFQRGANCDWEQAVSGTKLNKGQTIEFRSGACELVLDSGNTLALYGPAKFRLVDSHHGYLESGSVSVRSNKPTNPFTVNSAQLRVGKFGTEYSVFVDPELGRTGVGVLHGRVEVLSAWKKLLLEKEDCIAVDKSGRVEWMNLPNEAWRFARQFPPEIPTKQQTHQQRENTWVGKTGSWATSSRWQTKRIPDHTTSVVINRQSNVAIGSRAKALTTTLKAGSTVTIGGGSLSVSVQGTIDLGLGKPGANLVVKSGALLVGAIVLREGATFQHRGGRVEARQDLFALGGHSSITLAGRRNAQFVVGNLFSPNKTEQFRFSIPKDGQLCPLTVKGRVNLNGLLSVDSQATSLPKAIVLLNNLGPHPTFGEFHNAPEGKVFTLAGQQYSLTYRFIANGKRPNDVALIRFK